MIDNKTQRLALPLPNVDNYLEDDVVRLSEALQMLDAKVATVDDDGKIPVSQIPAVAITDTFPVNSEAAMLALDAQPGDVAIRNDLSKSFILMAAPATMLGNWKEIVNDALVQLAKPNGYQKIGGLLDTLKTRDIAKAPSSFLHGGQATSGISALLNDADGFYYMPKSGTITAPGGSAPDSNWICVGLLAGYETRDIRNFGGVGDGVADDTAAIKLWLSYINFSKEVGRVGDVGSVFSHYHIEFKEPVKNMWLAGPGTLKNIGGQVGAQLYANGAQLTFSGGVEDLVFFGFTVDGNRDASPSYTGFNHGIQVVTGSNDFRNNNGGDNKPNKRIRFSRMKFKNQGGFNNNPENIKDKFGDGIYLFGCDGVIIEECDFKDVGRWAIAASDVFNVKIINNSHDCTKAGTVALGFVDIENESTDNVNGSYSRDILIAGNTLRGFGQILVGAGSNSENYQGSKHYLRNVIVANNTLTVTGGPHAYPDYQTNLIFMGLAPFCNVATTQGVVENSNILFANNVLRNEIPSLSIGMGINGQGIGGNNLVKGVKFIGNIITGFSKGVQGAGVSTSGGYSLRDIDVSLNTIDCAGADNSIGVRLAATQLVGYRVTGNTIRGTKTRVVSIEDGRDVGAIDSHGVVGGNEMEALAGVNMFAYVYRLSMMNNTVSGSASAIDVTANNIDKDFGNTWNSLKRTIPSITIPNGVQRAYGGIDVGSHTRFGYTVDAAPPFHMGQATFMAYMTDPGFAMIIVTNLTGGQIDRASAEWIIRAEKR